MEAPADWPFDDPPNVATITTRGILDGSDWIAHVSHDDDDGAWQFIGTVGAKMDEAMLVGLSHVLESDRSVAELADLPLGWRAWRDGPDSPWKRAPKV